MFCNILLCVVAPFALSTEYRVNPVGIDTARPRLSWKIADDGESAYEIDATGWQSGKITSSKSVNVEWNGRELKTGDRVTWRVRVWNRKGEVSEWSEPASFSMGVLDGDWAGAKWIGPNSEVRKDEDMAGAQWITGERGADGSVSLRCKFDFAGAKPGEFVELVHAAVPVAEILLNGKHCNLYCGHVWDYRWLRYRDVTRYLKVGENEMVVKIAADATGSVVSGERAFIAKLSFPGGRTIVTGDDKWTAKCGEDKFVPCVRLGGVRDTEFGKRLIMRTETLAPAFEKNFSVKKGLKTATLFVTGVGFYEASLNGVKIGDKVLDPSPTDYSKRVLYSTYRMEDMLRVGDNSLRVLVGHGWYDMRTIGAWNFDNAPWRDFPRMIARIDLVYEDGHVERVVSDGSWRQISGPIVYDCLMEGEVVDARPRIDKGLLAEEVPAPKGKLVAEAQPGAKVVREFKPETIKDFGDGLYVVKFPVNFAGWIRLTLEGQRPGDVVVIRYDERVNDDLSPAKPSARDGYYDAHPVDVRKAKSGEETRRIDCHFRYTASHRFCPVGAEFQADRYLAAGGTETYEPRFSYKGFQYVVLRGLRRPPKQVVGCMVRTAFGEIGQFDSSDQMLNRLMEMAKRSYESNFADGVPTDCPHREKNGWTGDASIASELAQYLFENTAGYEKWLNDICDTQLPSGDICAIVPTSGWGFKWGNGPAWDSALPVIAWNLYVYRDDRRALDAVYPTLVRYLEFTASKATADGLVAHGLGDWIPVDRTHMPSVELTSSCYYLQAQQIASLIADAKGLPDDAAKYRKGAERTRQSINAKFYHGDGVYDNGGQTAQAMPITFGVVEPGEMKKVAARLAEAVERTGCHVDMGLLGTKHVFRALSRIGRTDLAYRMLVNPTAPSMAEWAQKGGTTLWEDWRDGASRNHIMFGDFAGWAYQYLAGIGLPETVDSCSAIPQVSERGFRAVVFSPAVVDGLDYVTASVDSHYGVYSSEWRRKGDAVEYVFKVPEGGSAVARISGMEEKKLAAGTWRVARGVWSKVK